LQNTEVSALCINYTGGFYIKSVFKFAHYFIPIEKFDILFMWGVQK